MIKERYVVLPRRFDLAGDASIQIKRTLKKKNLSKNFIKRVSAAAYEAEINIVIHSVGGYVDFLMDDKYIFLAFIDEGPGIADISFAMQEGYSTADEEARVNGFGAGMGLSNIKKSADAMQIESSKEGTHIKLWFYYGENDGNKENTQ
ncbi:hypothetical protein LJC17_01765 [Acholeplasma sp. OttesenSCG-928-E16]|nr:hypothetical protein [Acholeplasma sp. OttesenSCG-928-E16]